MINFKKVSAIMTSALMIGMTAGMAAAASFPAPFVSDGTADVAIVYGAGAATSDSVAAGNIQANLVSAMPSTGGTSGTTTSGGDSVLLAKSSDNINVGNMWDVFTGTIDKGDLSTLLADGTYIASDNDEFNYEQKITIGEPNFTHFRDDDYEEVAGLSERTPVLGFQIASNTFIMNYTLDFTSDAESDISSSRMEDIEGSELPLFGKTYYVSRLNNGTTSQSTFFGDMTLLDAADTGNINEGEEITVSGKKVSIDYIDSDEVVFIVDGTRVPTSGKLNKGDSAKIEGTTYLGVTDISKLEVSGETGSATISIGSGKLVISSSASATEVKLNDVAVEGVRGYVYMGTASSGDEKIDKIVIEWVNEDELFLTPGLELTMPGFEAIKFTMGDLVRPIEEKITIENDGGTSIKLTVPIENGDADINLLYANASGDLLGIGKASDDMLATSPNQSLLYYEKESGSTLHKQFVVSYNITSEAESYLLRAKVRYDSTDDRNETDIEKKVNGVWTSICEGKIDAGTCDIGSSTLTISNIAYTSGGNESVVFSCDSNSNFQTVFTKGGLKIYLPYFVNGTNNTNLGAINTIIHTAGKSDGMVPIVEPTNLGAIVAADTSDVGYSYASWYLAMDGEDYQDNIGSGLDFDLTINDNSDENLHVQHVSRAVTGGANGLRIGATDNYETYIVDDVAPRIMHYTGGDEDYVEVYYPGGDSESYAQVYLAETSVVVSSTGTDGTTTLGEVVIKDSEVATMSSKNLIVVGGSCINSVAANLVGAAHCEGAWTEATGVGAGKYLIQSFTSPYSSNKVALLVAGYNAADTTNAQAALIANTIDTTAGKKYTGTTSTDVALA